MSNKIGCGTFFATVIFLGAALTAVDAKAQKAAYTEDIGSTAANVVTAACSANNTGSSTCYTVPTGSVFVLETVSVVSDPAAPQNPSSLYLFPTPNIFLAFILPASTQIQGGNVINATYQIKARFVAGTVIKMSWSEASGSAPDSVNASLFGHLEPK